jgi:hypothetical protein
VHGVQVSSTKWRDLCWQPQDLFPASGADEDPRVKRDIWLFAKPTDFNLANLLSVVRNLPAQDIEKNKEKL